MYLDELTINDVMALEAVINEQATLAFRLDATTEEEDFYAEIADDIIANAPILQKPLTLYKHFEEVPELRNGGELFEKAFLMGSTKKSPTTKDTITLIINVPIGTPILDLSDGDYILGRRLKLNLLPSENDYVSATLMTNQEIIKESPVITTGTIGLWSCDIHEFFNDCHSPSDGRFCGGSGGGGGGSRGEKSFNEEPGKEGNSSGLNDEQIKNIKKAGHKVEDYDAQGKPIPGTDSWRDAHGISKSVYDSRPMTRWTSNKDPVFDTAYKDFPPNQKNFGKKIASSAGGENGLIMVRKPVPGAEEAGFGKIPPQARPDRPVVLDPRDVTKKTIALENAKMRQEKVSKFTPDDLIAERQAKVDKTRAEVKRLETHTAEEIRRPALDARDLAEARLKQAQKSNDPEKIAIAKEQFKRADYYAKEQKRLAYLVDNDLPRAVGIAKQERVLAEKALDRVKADPVKTLKNTQEYATKEVEKKQKQLEGVAVKYVFPPGPGNAGRIETNHDPQNLKNLTTGKGRVYFIMEGNIKADAALTAVKKEDPKAAVISIPSVTTWPKHGETDWVAEKYLKGRDVVLIPDADGVTNKAVATQAKKLAGKLRSNGVENVTIAAPPLVRDKSGRLAVEPLTLPSGVKDARKGLDDHLGLGKGTLGDLTFADTKPPDFDLTQTLTAKKARRTSIPNANKAMNAISDLAGDTGAGRISYDSIGEYTKLSPTSARDSTRLLEKTGVIKIHHIFDPNLLGEGRRVPVLEPGDIKRITRKAGVSLPDLDVTFITDENKHETAAIIEILDPAYITKSGESKALASKYKSLKTSGVSSRAAIINTGDRRIVRTSEGAKRYGVPIGSTIPDEFATSVKIPTGLIHLYLKEGEKE